MEVVVFGKHIEVPASLKALAVEKVGRIEKYASDVRRVEVDFAAHDSRRAADSRVCEILVHVNKHLVRGRASAIDPAAALDLALDKVERQMRRLHERRTTRRGSRRDDGGRHRAAATREEGPDGSTGADDEHEAATHIVKTKRFAVKPMDTEEAALQMELLGHDFFLFTNAANGRASVLYRRSDGRLGLIEATG